MYAHSNKTSKEIVIPKANGSHNNSIFKVENIYDDISGVIGNLCKEPESSSPNNEHTPDVYKKNGIECKNQGKTDTLDDCTGDSESEIEYPTCFESSKSQQHKETINRDTKIVDLPEFILVLTAFKVEDTVIIPPNDLLPEYVQVEREREFPSKRNYSKPSDVKPKNREIIKKHKALIKRKCPTKDTATKADVPAKHVHRIKYVRYSSSSNVVRREREIQVGKNECRTNEASVQCGPHEDDEAATQDNPELEWINHIIEAHMLNNDDNIYECHVCGEIALSYASKVRHSLIHEDDSLLCFQCGRYFGNTDELRRHEETHQRRNEIEIKKALRCPKLYCTKAFHSKKLLFKHIDEHARKTEERCSKCQRSFHSLFQYHVHKSKRNCWR